MQILCRVRERCTFVIPLRTRDLDNFREDFGSLPERTGEVGENCCVTEIGVYL